MQATTRTEGIPDTPEQGEVDKRLTLSQAARIAPGAPTPNCIWRWCRRGVIARSGDRVRLQHVRIGGKLFTTARWLDEFGRRLAEADAEYFEIAEQELPPPSVRPPTRRRARQSTTRRSDQADEARRARILAELEAEGL